MLAMKLLSRSIPDLGGGTGGDNHLVKSHGRN